MKSKALVFGSFVVDLMSRAPHLPEAGETVIGSLFKMGAGGKGFNQGVAAHKSGCDVTICTKIGDDEFGQYALRTMSELNIDSRLIFIDKEKGTGTALIGVDEKSGQNNIIVVSGACGNIKAEEIQRLDPVLSRCEYLLTQLETNTDAMELVVRRAKEKGVKVILNTAPIQPVSDEILASVDLITPNEVEAKILSGIPINSEESALEACQWFAAKGVKSTVITMGEKGAYMFEGNVGRMIPAIPVEAIDSTGAGDAFNGALLTALTEGRDLYHSVLFANACAGLSVQKLGTTPSMPQRKDILAFYRESYGIDY